MIKLSEVINSKFKLFESYPFQVLTENKHEMKVSNKTFEKILFELNNIKNSNVANLFYNDDLNDVIMFLSKFYIENRLSIEERLELLKEIDIEAYDSVINLFNNDAIVKIMKIDDYYKHSILNARNVPCFRNVNN